MSFANNVSNLFVNFSNLLNFWIVQSLQPTKHFHYFSEYVLINILDLWSLRAWKIMSQLVADKNISVSTTLLYCLNFIYLYYRLTATALQQLTEDRSRISDLFQKFQIPVSALGKAALWLSQQQDPDTGAFKETNDVYNRRFEVSLLSLTHSTAKLILW